MVTCNWPLVDVVSLKPLRHYRLWLRFSERSEGVSDLSDVLECSGPMIEPLQNSKYFQRAFVQNGAPTWPNGFDLDPINLYMQLDDLGLLVRIAWRPTMVGPSNDALISEVAGAGRWRQFNATFDIVREFFGTEPEAPYEIRLRHITSTGTLQGEERPAVIYKASRNWAFEINAARDLEYPDKKNRPIVVFLKCKSGVFLYRLLMPESHDYDLLAEYIAKNFQGPANQLRRILLTAAELKSVWPNSPLWKHWP